MGSMGVTDCRGEGIRAGQANLEFSVSHQHLGPEGKFQAKIAG